jgi:hypothetical protein
VVEFVKGIIPLPKFIGVGKTEVLTSEGGGGGTMPPLVVVITGVWGLPEKVASFAYIVIRQTNWPS